MSFQEAMKEVHKPKEDIQNKNNENNPETAIKIEESSPKNKEEITQEKVNIIREINSLQRRQKYIENIYNMHTKEWKRKAIFKVISYHTGAFICFLITLLFLYSGSFWDAFLLSFFGIFLATSIWFVNYMENDNDSALSESVLYILTKVFVVIYNMAMKLMFWVIHLPFDDKKKFIPEKSRRLNRATKLRIEVEWNEKRQFEETTLTLEEYIKKVEHTMYS